MSQTEIFRPRELGMEKAAAILSATEDVQWLFAKGESPDTREALIGEYRRGRNVNQSTFDEDLDAIREQFRRFSENEIVPYAQAWHLADDLIPDKLGKLGVFGICISTDYGGLALGKRAMCIVTEELSRAWITAGALGTRSKIAGALSPTMGRRSKRLIGYLK